MAKAGSYDGMIIGAILGLVVTTPKIAAWATDLINSLVPTSWYVFGSYSLTIFGLIGGALIGLIAEKTK